MSEYKGRIALFSVVAVVAAIGLAAVISAYPMGGGTTTSLQTPNSSTVQATTTTFGDMTTQNLFTLEGPVPLVTLGPQNSTFILTYSATTVGIPVKLNFSLSQSYVNVYTNGTQWVSFSQPCTSSSTSTSTQPSISTNSVTGVITITETATAASEVPCGEPPNSGWGPVNGTVVESYAKLTSNEISVSVLPSTFPANQTESLRVMVTLHLKPGVYVLSVFFGVFLGADRSVFEYSSLRPFPVIVKS